MKRVWAVEELIEQWSLGPSDVVLMPDKLPAGRLGFIAQLAFHRVCASFPEHRNDFAPAVLEHLAEQIGVSASVIDQYEWSERTGRRHRDLILDFLGVRPFDAAAEEQLRAGPRVAMERKTGVSAGQVGKSGG